MVGGTSHMLTFSDATNVQMLPEVRHRFQSPCTETGELQALFFTGFPSTAAFAQVKLVLLELKGAAGCPCDFKQRTLILMRSYSVLSPPLESHIRP